MPRGHLDLHARNAAPWDTGTSLDGTVVVERTDLAVLDGQSEGDPGGGEGSHAGVHTRALVEGEAEHTGGLWCCCVVIEGELVIEGTIARVVGSTGLRLVWRVSGERRKNEWAGDQESTKTYKGHTRGRSRYWITG